MKTQRIADTDLTSTRLAYGCMRIAGTWNPAEMTPEKQENAHNCLIVAYEAGYRLFDHADIYARGMSESLHGEVLSKIPSMRRDIVIATKCGVRFKDDPPGSVGKYDFSYDHILKSCDGSLKRLGIETIDIYQLHRPDVLMDPEEVCRAFEKLHGDGKVRYFGVSNFTPSYVDTLQKALPFKLVVNQVEISLTHRDCFFDGTLDQCIRENITPLSWSPLGGGWISGATVSDDKVKAHLLEEMDAVAAIYSLDRATLALAWLLKHPSRIIPIVGSANPVRIKASTKADAVEISREDWYRLLVAAQGHPMA
jgi:predicted oxidoreductase